MARNEEKITSTLCLTTKQQQHWSNTEIYDFRSRTQLLPFPSSRSAVSSRNQFTLNVISILRMELNWDLVTTFTPTCLHFLSFPIHWSTYNAVWWTIVENFKTYGLFCDGLMLPKGSPQRIKKQKCMQCWDFLACQFQWSPILEMLSP